MKYIERLKKRIILRLGILKNANLADANLAETNLVGADLTSAKLTRAQLTRADLREAKLTGADLTEADLREAKLTGADLTEADLTSTDLTAANLVGTKLVATNLTNANLAQTNLGAADFAGANLAGAFLGGANLIGVNLVGANLAGANLNSANLSPTNLVGADLAEANLVESNLKGADLTEANLTGAKLNGANLAGANLVGANLKHANLAQTNLGRADFARANLAGAFLGGANLAEANLTRANLAGAVIGLTRIPSVDLSGVIGLETVVHKGASSIGTDTIVESNGNIPPVFLRGCGLAPWEVEMCCLYDTAMEPEAIAELLSTKLFLARAGDAIRIGGVFVSYATNDSEFAEKIRSELYEAGASVWLDSHDMVAGDLHKQVGRAMRLQDIVLLILSKSSIESDWVEHELEAARKKEKEENRDVLCPVAIDESWKGKVENDVLWRHVKKKNVLDFSNWQTEAFEGQFEKLVKGMKLNYERASGAPDASS